jgi:hypothetical protein
MGQSPRFTTTVTYFDHLSQIAPGKFATPPAVDTALPRHLRYLSAIAPLVAGVLSADDATK